MRRSSNLAAALLLAATLTATLTTAPAAHADTTEPLRLTSVGRVVLDEAAGRLFLTTGRSGQDDLLVVGLDGRYQRQVALPGASDVEVLGDLVFVARYQARAITVLKRDTLAVLQTVDLGATCPGELASTAGKLVFGYSTCTGTGGSGGIGVLDLANLAAPAVTSTLGPRYDPVLAVSPGAPGLVVAGDDGLSPTTLYVLDVRGPAPVLVTARRDAGDGGNLRDLALSPDGTTVVSAQGSPYHHQVFTMPKLEAAGSFASGAYPTAVAWSADGGRVAVGSDASSDPDVFLYDGAGTPPRRVIELGAGRVLAERGLATSADGLTTWAVHGDVYGRNLQIRVIDESVDLSIFTAPAGPLTAGAPVTVNGHLVFADGSRTDGVQLSLTRAVTSGGVTTTTTLPDVDASLGDWAFTDSPPVGTVTWTVAFAGDTRHRPVTASTVPVEVVQPAPTYDLTITAPTAGVVGTPLTVNGRLTTSGSSVAGASLSVTRTDDGGTVVLAPVTTTPNGAWQLTDTPRRGGKARYTVSFGTTRQEATASATTTIALRPTSLTLTAELGRGKERSTAFVTARLGPTTSSRVVTITASTDGRAPVVVATGPVNADHLLLARYALPKGTTVFTARFAGDEGSAAATATTTAQR